MFREIPDAVITEVGGGFKRIKIPLIRRNYPQLIANKLVDVQPLLGPTGLVYYLRHRYASNRLKPRWKVQDRWNYKKRNDDYYATRKAA
jgi:hypothetical protein